MAASKKKARKTKAKTSSKKKTTARRSTRGKKKAAQKTRSAKKKAVKKKTKTQKKKTAKKRPKQAAKKTAKKAKSAAKKKAKKVAKKTSAKKKAASKKKSAKRPVRSRAASKTDSSLIHGIEPYRPKRGEGYMNETQAEHFKEILNAWREQLIDEISRTLHTMQDETVNHPDPNDRATQETDMSLELRSRDRERKLIRKIDETLLLIESGDYGFCENCGVEIGIERLEARPTARLCIDCKTLDEIRERQMV